MPLVRAAVDDGGELRDRLPHLVLRVEEVRPQSNASVRVRPEVADDAALAELAMTSGVVGRRDGDGAPAAFGVARRDDLEPGVVAEGDQEPGQREGTLAEA